MMPHGAPIQLPRWAVKVQGRGNTTRPGYRLGPPWAARHASTRQKVCPVIPLALLLWFVLAGVTDRRVGGHGADGAERAGTSYPTLTLLFDCLIRVGVNHSWLLCDQGCLLRVSKGVCVGWWEREADSASHVNQVFFCSVFNDLNFVSTEHLDISFQVKNRETKSWCVLCGEGRMTWDGRCLYVLRKILGICTA